MQEVRNDAKQKMEKTVEKLKQDFVKMRTGRANPAVLNDVRVDNYGQKVALNQVGNISTPDPKTILIQVWDKAALMEVEKAIRSAGLGLNPINDGKVIRVPVPPLSEDRRKELVKSCKKTGEEAKVALRNVRRDVNDELKKMKDSKAISEDDLKRETNEVQKITDSFVKKIDEMVESKEKELMTL